ncbi:MAG: isopeptide-forming domain-containing fimbrial protein [Lachnospiraceae bacterium]|nr:isopeptide-forming domain-containing fimbrial protein [Lachnospiraceae bacterium]
MKKLKRILAIVMSMAMVMGMSLSTFAATGQTPKESDATAATVSNVEVTATVTAYQVVKATYSTEGFGFTGYKTVDGLTIANELAPTSDEITAIANGDKSGLKAVSMSAGTADEKGLATFTANLNPGYWMVLVSGNIKEVYNPMLVGVAYSVSGSDSEMVADPLDANSNWTLVTQGAYAKSTVPTITKTIVGGDNGDKGDDAAIGDTVDFQISTAIPSYSKEYTAAVVKISDTLSTGLTLDQDHIVINLPEESYDITKLESGFVITIYSDYVLAHGTENVTVTYSATLNENAGINFNPNTNTATLEYSNNPKDSSDTKKTDDKTYHYTFGIDSKLFGESGEDWNKITKELLKTGEEREITNEQGQTVTTTALSGATFTLTNNTSKKVYTAVSNELGALAFTGLDAGNYTLVETVAPEGYSVNTTKIPVVITADYNADGTLNWYKITVDGSATSTYTATYQGPKTEKTITTIVPSEDNKETEIKNTKLSDLPSTGGIGTTIFTIGGCLIMIVAAGLFFTSRKKSSKNKNN